MRCVLVVALLSTACAEDLRFPAGFLFGTATAGFQVEMGCPTVAASACEDPNSDWYVYITRPELRADAGLFIEGDPPSMGPGFFELYEGDLDRAAGDLHGNTFRLSIEWSRLFPTATDGASGYDQLKALASPAALGYYHALFAALKARGLAPLVTLNHYTLPSWIHDAYGCHVDIAHCVNRGWLDHDRVIGEMAKYGGFVGQEFGGEVDRYATLNEPLTAVVLAGYLFQTEARTNPPGVTLQTDDAHAAMQAMIEAHARVYDAVKAADTVDADGDGIAAQVGIVYNLEAVAPADPTNPLDQTAAANAGYLLNQAFLDGITLGDLDADLTGIPVHRDDLANRLDFLGINYYARLVVQGTDASVLPAVSPLLDFNVLTLEYDYSYPRGIYEVLQFASRYHVPMVISETGFQDPDDTGGAAAWVTQTLGWVSRAAREGIPVQGYYYWSLMDNYEWNHGMTWKAGLYAVDPTDPQKARVARSPVAIYGRIATLGQVPADLAAQYPLGQ